MTSRLRRREANGGGRHSVSAGRTAAATSTRRRSTAASTAPCCCQARRVRGRVDQQQPAQPVLRRSSVPSSRPTRRRAPVRPGAAAHLADLPDRVRGGLQHVGERLPRLRRVGRVLLVGGHEVGPVEQPRASAAQRRRARAPARSARPAAAAGRGRTPAARVEPGALLGPAQRLVRPGPPRPRAPGPRPASGRRPTGTSPPAAAPASPRSKAAVRSASSAIASPAGWT